MKANQLATQADGETKLHVKGEVKALFSRGKINFTFHGLVVDKLSNATILGGMNFLIENQIDQQTSKHRIVVQDKFYIEETPPEMNLSSDVQSVPIPLKKQCKSILPGQCLKLDLPLIPQLPDNATYMIETDQANTNNTWLLQETKAVNRSIRIQNNSNIPVLIGKNQETSIVKVRPVTTFSPEKNEKIQHTHTFNTTKEFNKKENTLQYIKRINQYTGNQPQPPEPASETDILKHIHIAPGVMNPSQTEKCLSILKDNITVFDNDVTQGYNNYSGELDVDWNWLNNQLPPPNILKHPTYSNTDMKILLQAKIDFMESQNICMKAHLLGAPIQYASLPMLVPKSSLKQLDGKPTHLNYRFVMLFNKLNEYIALEPSQPDNIDETLYDVGQWKYIIVGDLSNSFHQRWISKNKLPWMAFPSPYKGMYVLLRSGQGMKNQSEGLQQKMRMVLGDLFQQGKARIIADDIQTGGNTIDEALDNWNLILQACGKNNIKIDPNKTKIFATEIPLLGWIKKHDKLIPDPHRILAIQKADFPKTVSDMRSYLGTYKTFFKSLPNMAQILHPLELTTGEKDGKSLISWTPELSSVFKHSQKSISNLHHLYQPKRTDQLLITLDWSKKGIGATLWAILDQSRQVVEFFSAKLKGNQSNWSPCDGEGLALAAAIKRFSVFLRETHKVTIVCSDNKTVVQALNLLSKGSFSTSPRLNALLASVNIYPMQFKHISGKFKLNQESDSNSRNPVDCDEINCSTCQFLQNMADQLDSTNTKLLNRKVMVPENDYPHENTCETCKFLQDQSANTWVTNIDIQDVIRGSSSLPFLSPRYIITLQQQDPIIQKLKGYLTSGARPRKTDNKNNEIKHYLTMNPKINQAGILVVERNIQPHLQTVEVPIIPTTFAEAITTATHIKLNHPNMSQMMRACNRNFFILKQRQVVEAVVKSCFQCTSNAKLSKHTHYDTNTIPSQPGTHWTTDVMKHSGQNIMVSTDNFSSFTRTKIIKAETIEEQKNAIIDNIMPFRSTTGHTTIRMDTAPALASIISNQQHFNDIGIYLEAGYQKNKNSLAKVDKTMQELREEIRKVSPEGKPISNIQLQLATEKLNMRIRSQNLSAREIFFKRRQETGESIDINDELFSNLQHQQRMKYNQIANKSSAPDIHPTPKLHSLVFLKQDKTKTKSRDLYMVTSVMSNGMIKIRKMIHFQSDQQGKLQPKEYIVQPFDVITMNNPRYQHQSQDGIQLAMNSEVKSQYKQTLFSFTDSEDSDDPNEEEPHIPPPDQNNDSLKNISKIILFTKFVES